jgi:hypothetical protein
MDVVSTAVTVASTATVVAAVSATRRRLIIKNPGSTTVYIGGANVTTTNGFPLGQNATLEIVQATDSDTSAKQLYYGIVSTGTQSVNVVSVAD